MKKNKMQDARYKMQEILNIGFKILDLKRIKSATCNLKLATFILLFIVYCSLFTVTTGCGKKAPPKPPSVSKSEKQYAFDMHKKIVYSMPIGGAK